MRSSSGARTRPPSRRPLPRAPAVATLRAPLARSRPPRGTAKKRGGGAKRSPQEVEALTKSLLAAIKRNPGQRIEQIGKEIGTVTKDLALPVKKLIGEKLIATKGQRRATAYFPR